MKPRDSLRRIAMKLLCSCSLGAFYGNEITGLDLYVYARGNAYRLSSDS